MKKIFFLLLICFGMNQVNATSFSTSDEETLVKLVDSLSQALVKQNKAWLTANLSDDCSLTDPTGQALAKDNLIKAFSAEGIYSLTKMKANDMKYIINGSEASATGNIEIEGAMSAQEVIDVSGTYILRTSFVKTASGWKISAINVAQ